MRRRRQRRGGEEEGGVEGRGDEKIARKGSFRWNGMGWDGADDRRYGRAASST